MCGQRRLHYLKHHHKVLYHNLLTSGKLHSHLADIEEQAQDLFSRLVKEHAEKEDATEQLKATDQMKGVQKMNSIRERVTEIIYSDVVFVWESIIYIDTNKRLKKILQPFICYVILSLVTEFASKTSFVSLSWKILKQR